MSRHRATIALAALASVLVAAGCARIQRQEPVLVPMTNAEGEPLNNPVTGLPYLMPLTDAEGNVVTAPAFDAQGEPVTDLVLTPEGAEAAGAAVELAAGALPGGGILAKGLGLLLTLGGANFLTRTKPRSTP